MNKMNKYIYIFAAFVVVVIIAFIVFRFSAGSNAIGEVKDKGTNNVVITKNPPTPEQQQSLLKPNAGDNALGSQYAPVTIIEYASLSCPHCAHLAETVIDPLNANYISKGKVKYVFRDFPLNAQAVAAAKLAHCADPSRFYSFINVLFKSQEQWAYTANYLSILKNIAKLGGIDAQKFDACQADKTSEDKIFKSEQDAVDILQVEATPTLFINGTKYIGQPDYKSVAAEVDKQLKGEVK